jgi:hypothetical protein
MVMLCVSVSEGLSGIVTKLLDKLLNCIASVFDAPVFGIVLTGTLVV